VDLGESTGVVAREKSAVPGEDVVPVAYAVAGSEECEPALEVLGVERARGSNAPEVRARTEGRWRVVGSHRSRRLVLTAIQAWLEAHEGPSAYLVLGLAAMLEYVVPPLPGDTITLFGVSLASSAGWSPWAIYGALNAGAVLGGQLAYYAGRLVAPRERRPRWLRGPRFEAELERVLELYRTRGALALALNRFVPAFRSVFFVGAGIAGLSPGPVLLWGAVSACAWNGLLVGAGVFFGATLEALEEGLRSYALFVVVVLAVLGVGWLVRRRRQRRNAPGAEAPSASARPDGGRARSVVDEPRDQQ
jgi:membrane protein DedA with SNARE-associated domain